MFYMTVTLHAIKLLISGFSGPWLLHFLFAEIPISQNSVNTSFHINHTSQNFILFYYNSFYTWNFYSMKAENDVPVFPEVAWTTSKANINPQMCLSSSQRLRVELSLAALLIGEISEQHTLFYNLFKHSTAVPAKVPGTMTFLQSSMDLVICEFFIQGTFS